MASLGARASRPHHHQIQLFSPIAFNILFQKSGFHAIKSRKSVIDVLTFKIMTGRILMRRSIRSRLIETESGADLVLTKMTVIGQKRPCMTVDFGLRNQFRQPRNKFFPGQGLIKTFFCVRFPLWSNGEALPAHLFSLFLAWSSAITFFFQCKA